MAASARSVGTCSSPTLDLHTDAIILREGAGAVASTHLHGSSSGPTGRLPSVVSSTDAPTFTPTPTPSAGSASQVTSTIATGPPPCAVPRQVFRAAPRVVVVGVGPATERARLRALAAQPPPRAAAHVVRSEPAARARAPSTTWVPVAAFALGSALVALLGDRALEIAALAATTAGAMTLAAAFSRRSRRTRRP